MTSPRLLLKAWGIRPRKSMGQHFLTDPKVGAMIVGRGAFGPQDVIVEIGAGLGALTIPLAFRTKHVFALEADRSIALVLKNELLASGVSNVTVIETDILECDMEAMAKASDTRLKVVGNLPYHISSQVLIHLIRFRKCIDRALVMFQKEVAERLLARPGSKAYGRLSILIQYCASIDALAHVGASSFYPRPRVDSEVIAIRFLDSVPFPAADEGFLFEIVRTAFGKRRKMLKNALVSGDLGLEAVQLLKSLERGRIDPRRRAETLSVEEFVRLADLLASRDGMVVAPAIATRGD
jgi:16S rRNA (adenine1518-N6/adenine1519-N6)-dimethyltransferase